MLTRWLVVSKLAGLLALVSMSNGPAFARDADSFDAGCLINWQSRLEGYSVSGVDVWEGTKIQAYLLAQGRVAWIQDGLPYVQHDSWSIRDCDTLCWELDRFDDLCSTLVATPQGVDLFDPEHGDRIFQWRIGSRGDDHGLMDRLHTQRFNPLAAIMDWLL